MKAMMWGYDPGWGGWLVMAFGMVLSLALLGVLVWALIRWLNGRVISQAERAPIMPPPGPSAFEILQQRYARGEIDDATYEQMRERLQASTPTGPPTSSPPPR
jgi:putative membrane protein